MQQRFGPVVINVISDKDTRLQKGYGFATFATEVMALQCMATKSINYEGRNLNFGPARRRQTFPGHNHHAHGQGNRGNQRNRHQHGQSHGHYNSTHNSGHPHHRKGTFSAGTTPPPLIFIVFFVAFHRDCYSALSSVHRFCLLIPDDRGLTA